jgi:hypothetical protein
LGAGGALGTADAEFAGVDPAPGGAGDLPAFLGDIGRRLRLHRVHINSDAPLARSVPPYAGNPWPPGPGTVLFGAESARLGDTAVPCRGLRW